MTTEATMIETYRAILAQAGAANAHKYFLRHAAKRNLKAATFWQGLRAIESEHAMRSLSFLLDETTTDAKFDAIRAVLA